MPIPISLMQALSMVDVELYPTFSDAERAREMSRAVAFGAAYGMSEDALQRHVAATEKGEPECLPLPQQPTEPR